MGSTLITALLLTMLATPAGAEESTAAADLSGVEMHCVVQLVPTAKAGVTETVDRGCFATELEAAVEASKPAFIPGVGGSLSSLAAGSVVVGRHYTGQWYTGSSITITASGCNGTIWKPTGWWNNNFESHGHYCGSAPTRFYDSSLCWGSSTTAWSWLASLGWMNNRASCIRYG